MTENTYDHFEIHIHSDQEVLQVGGSRNHLHITSTSQIFMDYLDDGTFCALKIVSHDNYIIVV